MDKIKAVSTPKCNTVGGKDTSMISREEIAFVMERLNHRPRKTLAFKTPHDIFHQLDSTVSHLKVETAFYGEERNGQ